MDENNNVTPNDVTPETSTPVVETASVTESTPTAETTPVAETAPQPAPSTADIYEKANEAAINPTASVVEETPVQTASSPMDSFSVPPTTTYASTDTTSSNTYANTDTTYNNSTYTSIPEASVSKGLAIASLVCGIISILLSCCCCGNLIFSIAGIICGCLQKPAEDGKKPGMATAGIITSIVGIVIIVISIAINLFLGDSLTNSMSDYYNNFY